MDDRELGNRLHCAALTKPLGKPETWNELQRELVA